MVLKSISRIKDEVVNLDETLDSLHYLIDVLKDRVESVREEDVHMADNLYIVRERCIDLTYEIKDVNTDLNTLVKKLESLMED